MLFSRGRKLNRDSSAKSNRHHAGATAATATIARACMEVLEERQLLANPVVDPINDRSVPGGKSLIVPITASDEDGDRLTYTVTSSNKDIKVRMHESTTWVKIHLKSTGTFGNVEGDMVFQLFGDFAPETVRSFVNLVKTDFYDGLKMHRLANLGSTDKTAWILQGGDKAGTGSGPSAFTLDDEYHRNGIFTGKGQLAMAKSSDDTSGTQFFITDRPTRHLDYDHTIFGQMVRGFDLLDDIIDKVAADTQGTPRQAINITSAEVVRNKTDGVLIIEAGKDETGRIRVEASDGTNTDTQVFNVRSFADTSNAEPYILRPVVDRVAPNGEYFDVSMKFFDLEGENAIFNAQSASLFGSNATFAKVQEDVFRIVPNRGYSGPLAFDFWVYRPGAGVDTTKAGALDSQRVVFMVGEDEITDVEGRQFNGRVGDDSDRLVATFRDTNPDGAVGDFTAQINWGDGTVSAGKIARDDDGTFRVTGSHKYAVAGEFKLVVKIESNLNASASGARKGILKKLVTNAVVGDAVLTPEKKIITGTTDTVFSNTTVGTFADPDTRDTTTDFLVTIDWGDGDIDKSSQTGAGVSIISAGFGTNKFHVRGGHQYAEPGTYPIKITVEDLTGGATTTINSEAFIGRPAFKIGTGMTGGTIAEGGTDNYKRENVTFEDDESGHTYTAKVNWGEGKVDDFVNLPLDGMTFDLVHSYEDSGTYEVVVIITDDEGNTASHRVTVTVSDVPPALDEDLVKGPTSAVRGEPIKITFGGATDVSEDDEDGLFRYEIDWGDGTTKQILTDKDSDDRLTSATHIYTKLPTSPATSFTIKIRVMDEDMTSSLATNEETLPAITVKAAELRVDPDDPAKSNLYVGGFDNTSATADDETILVTPHADGTPGKVVVNIDNKDTANDFTTNNEFTIPAGGRIIVFGGGLGGKQGDLNGNDTIRIHGDITNDVELYGGSGNDNLVARGGDDVLSGGNGNDTLFGGAGRDVMFGGAGTDTLISGDGDDLVFAGIPGFGTSFANIVTYDVNPTALRRISDEWSRTDLGYADRIDHITGATDGGFNGDFRLRDKNTTEDNNRDVLRGDDGRDVFFYGKPTTVANQDVLKDRQKNERRILLT